MENMKLKGIAASPGIVIGEVLVLPEDQQEIRKFVVPDIDVEIERLRHSLAVAEEQLTKIKDIADHTLGSDKAQIFASHILILHDPEFGGAVEKAIRKDGTNAEYALKQVTDRFVAIFEQMDNAYMKERAADIKDVSKRVQNILLGIENVSLSVLNEECILVAKDLTPSETAQLNRERVLGFITEVGGKTSHSAIMARSYEIPAVVGLTGILTTVHSGDLVIMDGDNGIIFVNPDQTLISEYRNQMVTLEQARKELALLKDLPSVTLDGKAIEIAGNVGSPAGVAGVLGNGGRGIGLFRTEFLYMDRNSLPDEEDQFLAYKETLEEMAGKPVIIRTLDIGGDKKLPYLTIPVEANPFLGYRAIRICLDQTDIFKTQLRALLRAGVYGNLKIMFPMISSLEELRKAKSLLDEVKTELKEEGIPYQLNPEIGMMIEIPSAALISDCLAREVDFFSIGSNDLIQYTVAVDRMNEKIADLYDPCHPAVLRLIKLVIDNAHRAGIWVGMCGEMAGDPGLIPILLGFGLDEFSMSISSLLKAKQTIRMTDCEKIQELVGRVLQAGTSKEVKNLIVTPI